MCNQQRLRSACAYAQTDQIICKSPKYSMTDKLMEHHLEFLGLKGGCTGLSESTHVKMPHCWKSRVTALILLQLEILNMIPFGKYYQCLEMLILQNISCCLEL